MKHVAKLVLVLLMASALPSSAEAQQWVYRPVMVTSRPTTRMYRRPVVVYQPTTVVYSRRRPVLGGYSVRVRPRYQRTVIW